MPGHRIFWRWFRNIKAALGDRKEAERIAGPEFQDDRPIERQLEIDEKRRKLWKQAQDMGVDPFENPFPPRDEDKKS
jgi:hypothetical protein